MQNNITIRKALTKDVAAIVKLLQDDILGKTREQFGPTISQNYYDAFSIIDKDPGQILAIAEIDGKVIATLQIIFITNISFHGAVRALIEGVHVDKDLRGKGIGQYIMEWAINEARKRNCHFVQLTSNKQRVDAHRFYERLGFTPSHIGFKLDLVGT